MPSFAKTTYEAAKKALKGAKDAMKSKTKVVDSTPKRGSKVQPLKIEIEKSAQDLPSGSAEQWNKALRQKKVAVFRFPEGTGRGIDGREGTIQGSEVGLDLEGYRKVEKSGKRYLVREDVFQHASRQKGMETKVKPDAAD